METQAQELPAYVHINQNEILVRRHKKVKEEDIAVCECKFVVCHPESACGEMCLNVLTSSECTPEYCPCGVFCRNQRFQKCEYANTRLFRTEGRGWGLRADETIKAGQFIIEYCGEVISWQEAKCRSQSYELQGLNDAYIISLNGCECIDATRKGSVARFINHSCQPNCETRKWNVLGEIRVGIFAKHAIPIETELSYDYNFEWYGGTKIRCLCGAPSCCGFLGAKSRGFQEDTYLWEDDDDRYSVEKIPLYDSAEDEPPSKALKSVNSIVLGNNANEKVNNCVLMEVDVGSDKQLALTDTVVQSNDAVEMKDLDIKGLRTVGRSENMELYLHDTQQAFSSKNAMTSRIESNTACRQYKIRTVPLPRRRLKQFKKGRLKKMLQKQVDVKSAVQLLGSKEAQAEVLRFEEVKNATATSLDSLYNEIRPAIEEHERDNQDSVSTTVAEKWIDVCCLKLKAEFDLYSSIVRNIICNPQKEPHQAKPTGFEAEKEIKLR